MKNLDLINKFLILKALEKVSNEMNLIQVKAMNYKNLSQADVSLLNLIVYGRMDGEAVSITDVKKYVGDYDSKRENLITEKFKKLSF